jgi:hypothetical protein
MKIKDWMGRECSTYGERRGTYRGLVEKARERKHLEDPGIVGRIKLKLIFEK